MIRRLSRPFLAFVVLALAWFASAQADRVDSSPRTASDSLRRVRVAAVEPVDATRTLRFSGVTRAVRRAQLSFPAGARLAARPVEVGDVVEPGQVVARQDTRELANAVDAAKSRLAELRSQRAQAERDHARVAQLVAAKAATTEELEQLDARLETLNAAVDTAMVGVRDQERRVGDARLTAPYAGTVTEVLLEPGEYAGVGRPVVVLAGEGTVEVEVEVPESVVARLALGDAVTVDLPALGRRGLAGRLTSIARTVAGPGRLFPVVVVIDDDGVAGGRTAEVALGLRDDGALAVPIDAVVNPGGTRPVIYRVRQVEGDSVVEKVQVTVGRLAGERVTIEGDLANGERVVIGGQRGLLDGEIVEVVP